MAYSYTNDPPTYGSNGFSRGQVEAETTLEEARKKHENELQNIKTQNAITFAELQRRKVKEIADFNISQINDLANKRQQLYAKYEDQVRKGILTDAEAQKKALDELAIYAKDLNLQTVKDNWAARKKAIDDEYKYLDKKDKQKRKDNRKQLEKERKEAYNEIVKAGGSHLEAMSSTGKISKEAVKEAVTGKETTDRISNVLINGLKQMFENTIQTYGQYQAKVNTRLQGSGKYWQGTFGIESLLSGAVGATPWLKTQVLMDNVIKATEQGIAFNIEQRAFLQTISENIASTFDAFDSNLMRIVRLQQADSTAARLGLEADLTRFLNSYFQDTSYLNNAFDSVSSNLIEATSLMSAEQAVAFEYQVQKWLGSLASVGFGDSALSAISQALGYLGSGNVSSLAGSEAMQNLLVMSASRAGLNYSQLLIDGLNESNTNKLLESMVKYLEEIAESDNKVVKSQYAQIFGMNVSDLTAVKNLSSSVGKIAKSTLSYNSAIGELYSQMMQLPTRLSMGGMLQNLMDNVNYSVGSSIAGNPVTYALWQITSMIEDLTGGIALPTFSVMGNSVDLNTTVTNLMRAGIVGVSTLGAIGDVISGATNTLAPVGMLAKLGILGGSAKKNRGTGLTRLKSLGGLSSSYQSNSSGNDFYDQTLEKSQETIENIKEENESTDITLNDLHEYMLSVFDPKMTEIERLVALLAGQKTESSTWGSFTSSKSGETYFGTSVKVIETEEYKNKNAVISNINSNVSSIKNLLESVINGNGVIHTQSANPMNNIPTGLS